MRIDSKGMVWSSGYPLTRFDPETGKFNDFPEADHTYSLTFDKDENVWFTNPGTGQIGEVDAKTLKVKQWMPPTTESYERRLAIDPDGIVWFGEFQKGKIGALRSQDGNIQGIRCAWGNRFISICHWNRGGSQRVVFVVLSGCCGSPRPEDREDCGISVSAFGEYHSRIFYGFRGAHVVRVAIEQ